MNGHTYEAHVFYPHEQDVAILRIYRRDKDAGQVYVPEEITWRKLGRYEHMDYEKSLFPLERRELSMLAYDVDKFGPSFYHWAKEGG